MFELQEIQTIEEIIGCKLPQDVADEAMDENSLLWEEKDAYRFAFITADEHRQMQPFIRDKNSSPLQQIPELKILWMDGESNFLGMFVSGPMSGRLALIGHDTNIDCAPLYRSLKAFLKAAEAGPINSNAEWPYRVDYPNMGDEIALAPSKAEMEDDLASIEQIRSLISGTSDLVRRRFLSSCIISLTPKEQANQLLPTLQNSDYHVCGRACSMLGCYQCDDACKALAEISLNNANPARFRAVDGLGLMRTKASQASLIELVRTGVQLPGNITSALRMNSFEVVANKYSEAGRKIIEWQVRVSPNSQWEKINIGSSARPGCWWLFK